MASTIDFCGLQVALRLRTVTGLRAEVDEGLGFMLVPRFSGVGLVEWVRAPTRVRSLQVAGGSCWDVNVGKVVLGRFKGCNSNRVTASLTSTMAPTTCWAFCHLGLPF